METRLKLIKKYIIIVRFVVFGNPKPKKANRPNPNPEKTVKTIIEGAGCIRFYPRSGLTILKIPLALQQLFQEVEPEYQS